MKDVEFNFSVLFLFPFYATENYTGRKETYYSGTLYDKENNKKARKVLEIITCSNIFTKERQIRGNFIKLNEWERYFIVNQDSGKLFLLKLWKNIQ